MVESRSPKPLVVGSSPTAPAKTHSDSSGCVFYFPGNFRVVWLITTLLQTIESKSPEPCGKTAPGQRKPFQRLLGSCPGCRCAACPVDLLSTRARIRQPYQRTVRQLWQQKQCRVSVCLQAAGVGALVQDLLHIRRQSGYRSASGKIRKNLFIKNT